MQEVFATEILRTDPASQVVIASPFPDLDRSYYGGIDIVRSRRRNLPLGVIHWVFLELFGAVGVSSGRYILGKEIDTMLKSDVVVDLSGDMLTEDYGFLVGFSHFLPLLQAQASGVPVVICAQSIGPFKFLAPLAKRILSRSRLVTVRESISLGVLQKFGCSGSRLQRTADLAFMLRPADDGRLEEIRAIEKIPTDTRPVLGVSVSALLANKANTHLDADHVDLLTVFARALDRVSKNLKVNVLIIPHVFGPRQSGDDRLAGQKLVELMEQHAVCLSGEYSSAELKGIISGCSVFVGCRMHANIAALDSGVPVLAIGYSHKTRGIMGELDLGEWVMSFKAIDADSLSRRIEELFSGAQSYRRRLATLLPEIRQRSRCNITEVLDLRESLGIGQA